LCAAPLVLLGWGWWELHVEHPLVDLRASSRRPVLATNACALAVGAAMYSMNLIAPRLLQIHGRRFTPASH